MRRSGPAILIVGLALLAGCSSSTAEPKASGILNGGIYNFGGPIGNGCPGVIVGGKTAKPISGKVVVSSSGHTVATVHVKDGESYRLSLQPGRYTVSEGSLGPRFPTVVIAGKATTANVIDTYP